jgi:lipopolysaccharide export system protein LptC
MDGERVATPAASRAGSRAYARARRHSGRVRFFRRAIPIGAALAVGFVAVIALFDPLRKMGGLTLGPISLSGTQIAMESPRLSGFRKDNRAYEVTATAALQDVRKPTIIELRDLRARLAIDDAGNNARLEAATGVFDTQKEHLEVRQDVRVRTDNGQEADLKSAMIDFKAGTVVSNEAVQVRMPDGTVDAEGLSIRDNGKIVTFTGSPSRQVRVVLRVDTASERSSKAAFQASAAPPQAGPASLRP